MYYIINNKLNKNFMIFIILKKKQYHNILINTKFYNYHK